MSEEAPLKKYEVEVTGSFTAWIDVEAEDEEQARDEAISEARSLSTMDWNDDGMYHVESVTETKVAS